MEWNRRLLRSSLICGVCCAVASSGPTQAQQTTAHYGVNGEASGRAQLLGTVQQLKLAQPNEVPITLHGHKVYSADAAFSYFNEEGREMPPDTTKDVRIIYHPNGDSYLELVPERVGKVHISVSVYFVDGKVDTVSVDSDVIASEVKPETLYVSKAGSGDLKRSATIYMDLSTSYSHSGLDPMAVYKGVTEPIPIPAKNVTFKLISAGDSPISIDEATGRIDAIRVGEVLVLTKFSGMVALTCIDVVKDVKAGGGGTDCGTLVPVGMRLPPVSPKADAFPRVRPRVERQ